ncbi:MAG TPA: beta-propeller domain-containing protein [Pyrinomonadaceae bacterium]|nr:beta-propeller domain-containing protein [Pyrinomonadaceae bacterium]
MKTLKSTVLFLLATAFVIATVASCADVSVGSSQPTHITSRDTSAKAKKTMRPFRTEIELRDFFRKITEERQKEVRARREAQSAPSPGPLGAAQPTTTAAPAEVAKSVGVKSGEDESVTNVQHAGVDEGGIVKLHGNHLVVLRRGRLFTVAINDNTLQPISVADAFGPEINPEDTWYDEMLVSENTVVVIGYSYDRGGTEIGLFNIDGSGNLRYRSTYHLRSNDYYSSRNYASRLIGSKLIFYTPLYLSPYDEDPTDTFPAMRKWHKGAKESEFHRIVAATRVYRPEASLNPDNGMALHTVTVCDLSRSELACEATAVLGAPGRVFYVSPESVYVWTSGWGGRGDAKRESSMLYRMPLDGSGPSALKVSGSPVDQFSFLESEDSHLNVLVRSEAAGDGMWSAEVAAGEVALMRVSLGSFSDGSEAAAPSNYRELPKPEGDTFQNRFVGDYLLYGTGSGWGRPENIKGANLYAVRWAGGNTSKLKLVHGVDRIEALGSDAIVVGTDGEDLHFTGVRLGQSPELAHRYTRKGASQGELRSHGFFYKPDGPDSGLLGLPVSLPGRPGYEHLFDESAAILFLRNESLDLKELGELEARPEKATDDACRASCVDWYGNSRPLFVRGRVFALLGYEIVEGKLNDGRIRETRRISYAPKRRWWSRG